MSYECYCDYDTPDFYHVEKISSARKSHKCYECGCQIQAGENYERIRAKWDGDCAIVKTCKRCLALREYVKAHVPCFCFEHGNVNEQAIEEAKAWNHEAPGFLFGAYRLKVEINRARKGLQQ